MDRFGRVRLIALDMGIAVLTVPWSVRNTLAFHTPTGTSTNLGDDLCIGNFQGATGAFLLRGKCFEGFEGLSPQQVEIRRNREGIRIAIKDIVRDPFRVPGVDTIYQDCSRTRLLRPPPRYPTNCRGPPDRAKSGM